MRLSRSETTLDLLEQISTFLRQHFLMWCVCKVYAHVYIHTCTYVYMYAHVFLFVFALTQVQTHAHTHTLRSKARQLEIQASQDQILQRLDSLQSAPAQAASSTPASAPLATVIRTHTPLTFPEPTHTCARHGCPRRTRNIHDNGPQWLIDNHPHT